MEKGCIFEVWGRVGGMVFQAGYGCTWVFSMEKYPESWEVFSKNIRFEVEMGDRVKFWTYWWCGDLPLQLSFSIVYGIATNREASVASSLEQLGIEAQRSWNVCLIREPNDWSWVLWMNSFIPWDLIYLKLRMETV